MIMVTQQLFFDPVSSMSTQMFYKVHIGHYIITAQHYLAYMPDSCLVCDLLHCAMLKTL